MNVIFKKKDKVSDIKSIASFFTDEQPGRVQNYICEQLKLERHKLYQKTELEVRTYLAHSLAIEFEKSETMIDAKVTDMQLLWNREAGDILMLLEKIFCLKQFKINEVSAEFTVNVVCPRYLERFAFDINYRKNKDEMLLVCIHELIHFFWFEKWKIIFETSDSQQFEAPSLIWLFSEIAIDSIINETELKKYCLVEKPAYQYLYEIQMDGINMMQYFRELFKTHQMTDFMKVGIKFLTEHADVFE